MKVELPFLKIRFSKLDAGDVFLFDDDLYMKIERPEGRAVNAVDIEDGSLLVVDKDQEVTHFPNATMRVEEPDGDDGEDAGDEDEDE